MSLWSELKRRNVVRVTTAYVVVSWLLLQVLDVILDFAGAPDWIGKLVLSLLAVGIVPTIALAWLFEITPDGIRRDDGQAHEGDSVHAQRLNVITIVAIVMLGGLIVWQQLSSPPVKQPPPVEQPGEASLPFSETSERDASPPGASIAVLPFADLSPAGDQSYFSDGISEEILNALVRVDGLSVASRTSAFAFKGQAALGIPAIAEALKVRHVLEGSVRSAGKSIRITAQLIDAETDKHLWSQTYDRELSTENVFAIQDEIASAIVNELASSMPTGRSAIGSVRVSSDTENLDAYQLYLRGREGFLQRSFDNIPTTIELLEQATALDPGFARAWATLSAVYVIAPSWGHVDRDYYELTENAARRAISLDDRLGLPYAVLGNKLTEILPPDFAGSMKFYQQALDRDSRQVTALLWRGIDNSALGFFDRAANDLTRCLEIDPAYENCRRFLAQVRLFAGDTQEAFRLFEQGVAEGATSQGMSFVAAYAHEGDHRAALLTLAGDNLAFVAPYKPNRVFRALTEPDFAFEKERRAFEIEYLAATGNDLDWSQLPFVAVIFRSYDSFVPNNNAQLWWHPGFPDFLASPHRKRAIREMAIYDYWRSNGFPPRCRPMGDNDFECD